MTNPRPLSAAALMSFVSGFGQTFFIAIFAGVIRGDYGISHGAWGGYYAAGTLASAALMLFAGGLADACPPKKITLAVMTLFAVVCLAMAGLPGVWALPIVICGLRFCGQGMMSHLSAVFAVRWFVKNRGKAVAVASLGFSTAEAVLPFAFVSLTLIFGWRASWGVAAALILLLAAVMAKLLATPPDDNATAITETKKAAATATAPSPSRAGMNGKQWTRRDMLSHWLFWLAAPALLVHPAAATVFFFQLAHLAESKQWQLQQLTALLPVYTAASLASLLVASLLADKLGSARRLLPFFLLPLIACLSLMATATTLPAAAVALAFLGLTQGASVVIGGLFWAEHYGNKHLGAIRAVASSCMVFSTAAGPFVSGVLLDNAVTLESQFKVMALMATAACGVFLFITVAARKAFA